MAKRNQVPSRQYTGEFKLEAVRLVDSTGGSHAAQRLGIPESSLWNWLRLSRAGKLNVTRGGNGQVMPGPVDLEAENERLRRELANIKLDLEIVKKSGGVLREGIAVKYAWIESYRELLISSNTTVTYSVTSESGKAYCTRG